MESILKHVTVEKDRTVALAEKAEKYSRLIASIITKRDYTANESALAIISDEDYRKEVCEAVAHLRHSKHVVLVGIGGSSLGTEAVYSALAFKTQPKLHVLDDIEEDSLNELRELAGSLESKEDIAVVIVSKSGTTTETVTNGVKALEILKERFDNITDRVVFIGTSDTDFMKIGKKEGVTCVTFPESIGGRFSVFTAVGIVPLYLLGIDIETFCEGGAKALTKESRQDTVMQAAHLAALAEGGVDTVNFFTFNDRLVLLGHWYRQLLAESIGKNMTTQGTTFCHQLLPTITTSVELHSIAQLYLGGFKGVFTHFVYTDTESEFHKLTDHWLLSHMDYLEGHTPEDVKNAIRKGVLAAYDDQGLPYRLSTLTKLSVLELGELMASLMFEVMILAHMFDVNAFDQPAVESYKDYTRRNLKK